MSALSELRAIFDELAGLVAAEPVRFHAAVIATVVLVAKTFGVDLDVELFGVAVAAWLAFVTREKVTPSGFDDYTDELDRL